MRSIGLWPAGGDLERERQRNLGEDGFGIRFKPISICDNKHGRKLETILSHIFKTMPSYFKLFLEYFVSLICDNLSWKILCGFIQNFPQNVFGKLNFTKFLRPHIVANNFGTFWKSNYMHNLLGKLNSFISQVIVTTCVLGTAKFSPFIFLEKLNVKLIAMTCHRNYDTPIKF